MAKLLFDQDYYLAINEARWPVLEAMLALARRTGAIDSVLDAGCGPGWFADRLAGSGLQVLGVDARPELVEEARRRVPAARFETFDFDADAVDAAPPAHDAVFAFGLLYHLENPLRALRILRRCARRALFLETMTIPEGGALARLVRENPNETQGVHGMALVLTPEAIAEALTTAGFPHVYRYAAKVEHADFTGTPERRKRRDIFLALDAAVEDPSLERMGAGRIGRYDYGARAG